MRKDQIGWPDGTAHFGGKKKIELGWKTNTHNGKEKENKKSLKTQMMEYKK